MSGDRPDLEVPPEALALIAQGIDKAHGELMDLGMIGEASMGRGFSDLALSGVELGQRGTDRRVQDILRALGVGRTRPDGPGERVRVRSGPVGRGDP